MAAEVGHPQAYRRVADAIAALSAAYPTDALVPLVMLALFPIFEWIVHVFILHWRPTVLGPLTIDPLLAREHCRHHVEPRTVALALIPWPAPLRVLPVAVAIALLAFPRIGLGLSYLSFLTLLGLGYEWCHCLIHSDYQPRRAVTRSATAVRILGTCPDPATIPRSPTARSLHAAAMPVR